MSIARLLNATHAVLIEGMDEEGEKRLDATMAGDVLPAESQAEAFLRARGRRPERGAPLDLIKPQGPPPRPPGIPLAPAGVLVREPSPTVGLEHLRAALEKAR